MTFLEVAINIKISNKGYIGFLTAAKTPLSRTAELQPLGGKFMGLQ